MNDIELPPLPHWCEAGSPFAEQMQSYARAAVEADRAQRVPDGWKLVPVDPTDRMLNAASLATESEGMVTTPWLRKTIYSTMLSAAPAQPAPQPVERKPMTDEINQCDGCRRGLPLKGGMHTGPGVWDKMVCQKHRYEIKE